MLTFNEKYKFKVLIFNILLLKCHKHLLNDVLTLFSIHSTFLMVSTLHFYQIHVAGNLHVQISMVSVFYSSSLISTPKGRSQSYLSWSRNTTRATEMLYIDKKSEFMLDPFSTILILIIHGSQFFQVFHLTRSSHQKQITESSTIMERQAHQARSLPYDILRPKHF